MNFLMVSIFKAMDKLAQLDELPSNSFYYLFQCEVQLCNFTTSMWLHHRENNIRSNKTNRCFVDKINGQGENKVVK